MPAEMAGFVSLLLLSLLPVGGMAQVKPFPIAQKGESYQISELYTLIYLEIMSVATSALFFSCACRWKTSV
jgi:hypothetical protein